MNSFKLQSLFSRFTVCLCMTFVILCGPGLVHAQNHALRAIAEEMKQAKKRSKNAIPSLPASGPSHSFTPDVHPRQESRIRNPFEDMDGATDNTIAPYTARNDAEYANEIETARRAEMAIPRLLREQRSDARIYDVCFVNPLIGWAVGDRGTIWKTIDGGMQWTLQNSHVDCSLRSVSFIDTNRGLAVGGSLIPFTDRSEGIILGTYDGGDTWEPLPAPLMPMLHRVKMETRSHAWIAGEVSPINLAGLFRTSDAGRTWLPLPNFQSDGWKDFRFLDPQTGAGITANGEVQFLQKNGHQSAIASLGFPSLDATRFSGIELFHNQGWLVGKQGTVCSTQDCGKSWQNVGLSMQGSPITEQGVKCFDFQTVFARESNVWIAGKPGTMIFYSKDAGRSWNTAATGTSAPIRTIRFSDPNNGFAVGDLGTIIATTDGGRTWNIQRQGGSRLAVLGFFARAEDVPLELIAQYSSESGYLSGMEILTPFQSSVDNANDNISGITQNEYGIENRTHEAIVRCGGSYASHFWGFTMPPDELKTPLNQMVHHFDFDAPAPNPANTAQGHGLLRFRQQLIRSLRIWKPSVVVVPDSRSDHPMHKFLAKELSDAIPAAADPNVFPEQIHEAGLTPWKAAKLCMVSQSIQGEINLAPADYAFRIGRSLEDMTFASRGLIQPLSKQWYSLVGIQPISNDIHHNSGTKNDLFGGITLAPGSEARRIPLENAADMVEQNRNAAHRRSQIIDLGMKMIHEQPRNDYPDTLPIAASNSNSSLNTINVLRELLREFPGNIQTEILLELGLRAQQKYRWDVAESIYMMMLEQFPQHPYAEIALRWLIQYNASKEVFWSAQRKIELAAQDNRSIISSDLGILADRKRRESVRQESVKQFSQLLKVYHPQAFASPQITFALASTLQEQERFDESGKVLSSFLEQSKDEVWNYRANFNLAHLHSLRSQSVKSTEELLSRIPGATKSETNFISVKRTINYPHLDGVFDDETDREIWAAATLIAFTPGSSENVSSPDGQGITLASAQLAQPLPSNANLWNEKQLNSVHERDKAVSLGTQAMFMYDDEFLYIALRCRKSGAFTYRPVDQAPRPRDPDLSNEDRVEILLDTNRDFGVCYKLIVDHRGWVGDECWGNKAWNPAWFVAREEEERYWMIEAAIPWEQLTDVRPDTGTFWGIALRRIIPGVGIEHWNNVDATNSLSPLKSKTSRDHKFKIGTLSFE